jgi:hypothetical protein
MNEYNELMMTTNYVGPLSESEQKELQECEADIESGLIKMANALIKIRDKKLYRAQYGTFEAYCKARWDIKKSHAYRLLNAAEIVQNLQSVGQSPPMGDNVPPDEKDVVTTPEPTHERQLRPLAGLSPEQQREAWAIATANNPKPTDAEVEAAVKEVKAKEATKVKIKESEVKIIEYLKAKGYEGATSDQIEAEIGVAHQRVSDLLKKGDVVYQTMGGKRVRKSTVKGKKAKAYVIVLAEFAEVVPPPKEPEIVIRSGQPAEPEDRVPVQLLGQGGIISGDMLVKGHAVTTDASGGSCSLPIGVSALERHETVAFTMAGSEAFKDRKGYYKWQRYKVKKIRGKVLAILEQMSPLEIPKGHKVPAVAYQYNLSVACDLQELAEMLYADLSRQASMLKNREKYGHLYPNV